MAVGHKIMEGGYIMKRKIKTITISRKEYEGMKETIEILSNATLMKKLVKSLKEVKDGKAIRIA